MDADNDKKSMKLDTGDKILIILVITIVSAFITLTFYEEYLQKTELPFIEKTVLHYANVEDDTQEFTITLNTTDAEKFFYPQTTIQDGVTWEFQFSEVIMIPVGKLVLGFDKDGYFCKEVNEENYYPLKYCRESIEDSGLDFDEIKGDKLQ